MLKIWTDKKGKVHCFGKGDATVQLKEIDAIVSFLARYGAEMNTVSAKILHTAPATLQMMPTNLRRVQTGKDKEIDPVKDESAK